MISNIIEKFDIESKVLKIETNTQGHINNTYIITTESGKKYTLQKINTKVFHHPDQVMANIEKVTTHIKSKIQDLKTPEKRCLNIVYSKERLPFVVENNENYYRCYDYIDNVKTYQKLNNSQQAYLLGQAISSFQSLLSDLDGSTLYETIPNFHNMNNRYRLLDHAVKTNPFNRVSEVEEELDFLYKNKDRGNILWNGMKNGTLLTRVTHNDTKINNILFSLDGKEALCVIDLDTIMPGTLLFDVGDMVRTATSTAEEDTTKPETMHCNPELYGALMSGYLSKASSFITKEEKELLFESGRNMTQIMAVRMLTDYIIGDVYYHIDRPKQNLDRTRAQIALMKDLDANYKLLKNLF